MMKNAFYFTLKALFILKVFKFLSRIFGLIRKKNGLIGKINVVFKIYDVRAWEINNWNAQITEYFKK